MLRSWMCALDCMTKTSIPRMESTEQIIGKMKEILKLSATISLSLPNRLSARMYLFYPHVCVCVCLCVFVCVFNLPIVYHQLSQHNKDLQASLKSPEEGSQGPALSFYEKHTAQIEVHGGHCISLKCQCSYYRLCVKMATLRR